MIDEDTESHLVAEGPNAAAWGAPAPAVAMPAAPEPGVPSLGAGPRRPRAWPPWALVASVLLAGGAALLAWWLTQDDGLGEAGATTSVPAEEITPLSSYLAELLEAEMPVARASAAANAAGATAGAADAQRALAAAFGLYRSVARLQPPPSASAHQALVLDLADRAGDLYAQVG